MTAHDRSNGTAAVEDFFLWVDRSGPNIPLPIDGPNEAKATERCVLITWTPFGGVDFYLGCMGEMRQYITRRDGPGELSV